MSSQSTTDVSLQTLIEKEGAVILARSTYDALIKRIETQKEQIKRAKQEILIGQIIAQGEAELKNNKTIVASSSKEALQKYYGRKQGE